MYRSVQTIGKRYAGGERAGLFNIPKASMLLLVISPERPPTIRGKARQKVNNFIENFKNITSVSVYAWKHV